MIKHILIALILVGCISCDNLVFDETPKTHPIEVYDAFVEELNAKNPFLQYISSDVDSLFEAHRNLIKKVETGQQLISSMDEILNEIKDAHTGLVYSNESEKMTIYYSKWKNLYSENELPDISHYFASYSVIGGEDIEYGILEGKNIGYLKLNTFLLGRLTKDIRSILKSFNGTDGLIIDLRSTAETYHNYSTSLTATDILEMLNDSSGIYLYRRIKKPISRISFSEWEPIWLTIPDNSNPIYTKSIAVLINRQTKDAAELLTAGIILNSSGIIIGDTTAGFIGYPDFTHLTGEWYMDVSMTEYKLPENYVDSSKRFQGIPPDIAVEISSEDFSAGIDTILERAIEELSK